MSEVFNDMDLELEDYWRAIILRGRNEASYKFSLAKTLLDLKPESGQLIKIGVLISVQNLPEFWGKQR